MRLYSRKNQKLLKQFPFLEFIISNVPLDPAPLSQIDDLTIKVEKADGSLMFRQAQNTGLGDENSWVFRTSGSLEGMVGRIGEYMFAFGHNGEVLNRLSWPRNDDEKRGKDSVYGRHVFWTKFDGRGGYSNPIWKKTKFLVWVNITAWYEDLDTAESRFGPFRRREAHLTVYGAPEQGFEKLDTESNLIDHLYLSERVIADGVIRKDDRVVMLAGRLEELAYFFHTNVYLEGVKQTLDGSTIRGASGKLGDIKILAIEMLGYHRITIENSEAWASFQIRPDSEYMTMLSCGGTLPQVRNLTYSAVKAWPIPSNRESFKPDSKVSLF